MSNRVLELYNLERKEDILNKSIFDFVSPKDRNSAEKDFKEALKIGYLKMVEYNFLKEDNSEFIGELSLSIIKENNKTPKFLIGMVRDITNQKKIEEDLKNSQQMFQLVIDNIPQFIFWKDIDSVYIGCNKNFARIAGVKDPKDIVGKTDYDLVWKKMEAENFFETDRLVLELNKPEYHIIESQFQADGKQAWLDKNKIPLHNSKGEVVGILGTSEDITDRLLAKEKLEDSEKKFREAYNRAEFYKDLFAHDMSNILQNILTAIEISYDYKKDYSLQNQLEKFFEVIKNQVDRGAELISNVKKLSLIDNTQDQLETIKIDEVLGKSIKLVRNKFPNRETNIKVESIDNTMRVKANDLLLDVFMNILNNAIKYNENLIIDIIIKISKFKRNSANYVKIEFLDNGIGIPDVQKNRIFENEITEDKNLTRIGLGLSLVRRILEMYKAKIWVEDKIQGDYSKGSRFIILIPEP